MIKEVKKLPQNELDKIYGKLFADIIEEEDELMNSGYVYTTPTKKRGRPKKNKVAQGHPSFTLTVVGNGYIITVGTGSVEDTFVFDSLEKVTEWMKNSLSPKLKNAEFMEAL